MTARTHRLGLTTSEAARHLGVSLSTIRRWSDLGYLRGYRTPGGQRRFSIQQLDEFLESLESGAPPRQAEAPEEPADQPTFSAGSAFREDEPGAEEPRVFRRADAPAPRDVWPPDDAA